MPRPSAAAVSTAVVETTQPLSARQVLQAGRATVAKLSLEDIKSEQIAWRVAQKYKQLHEQRMRIIVDDTGHIVPHRSHDLPPQTPNQAEEKQRQERCREGEQARPQPSVLLVERYQTMKADMREETATLRSVLASSTLSTTPLPVVVDGDMLPPTTSPLLGTFSPHLVSHHLPALFSYPVFHFGRDAFQPHLAYCCTLNQAHQLVHRINQQLGSSALPNSPIPSSSSPLTSYLYAYHIGSGVGRLANYADGPFPGAGERLLYQLQSFHTTNLLLLVTCHSSGQTVSGGGVGGQVKVASEQVRCVVRVAKGMLREWQRCVEELKAEQSGVQQNAGAEEKEGEWKQDDNPVAHNDNTDAPVATFITQPLVEVEGVDADDTGAEDVEDMSECALPFSPPLVPRLTHTARLNHYLHTLSSSLPALALPPPPRTTPTAVYWTLPSLRADILTILFPTMHPTSTSAFLSSASLLAVRWQLLPCLEHEREWMASEEVWEGVRDWLEKESTTDSVRQQWVEGSWSVVRRSVWDVYVRQMKFMHPAYLQANMEAMAAMDNPPLILRLLLLAVGGVLGWPQLQWPELVPYLTGLRALPPQDIFAEFPPPPAPSQSAPASPHSSVAPPSVQHASSIGLSPYEHSHVMTNPLLGEPSSTADGVLADTVSASGPSSSSTAMHPSRYSSFRSDLFAHLLSFDLFALSSSTLQRVQSALCEHALAPSELPSLDRQVPGSRWLVQWLVLVVRCGRLWQLSRQVFKVQVEDEAEQADSTDGSSTTSTEHQSRQTACVDDVEIEHDSGERDAKEVGESAPSSAFTDRGWTASRAASAAI